MLEVRSSLFQIM